MNYKGEASAASGGGGGRAAGCVGERSELTAGGLAVAAEGSRLRVFKILSSCIYLSLVLDFFIFDLEIKQSSHKYVICHRHTKRQPRQPRTTHMTHNSKGAKFIIRTKSTLWVLFQLTKKEPTGSMTI